MCVRACVCVFTCKVTPVRVCVCVCVCVCLPPRCPLAVCTPGWSRVVWGAVACPAAAGGP